MNIRKAADGDWNEIRRVLDDLELGHPSLVCEGFWVAEADGAIIGVAHVEDRGACVYLSAVGVEEIFQGRGVASDLLRKINVGQTKDVYVYTLIPDFFRRHGFEFSEPHPDMPPRNIYDCGSTCRPSECRCMILRRDAAKVSTI